MQGVSFEDKCTAESWTYRSLVDSFLVNYASKASTDTDVLSVGV